MVFLLATLGLASASGLTSPADPLHSAADDGFDLTDDTALIIDGPAPSDAIPEVVGGKPAEPGVWPDVAFVDVGDALCTGVLIHPQWVLTAGHCVVGETPRQVFLNATLMRDIYQYSDASTTVARRVERAVAHPAYVQAEFGHDIALLKLSEPVYEVPPRTIATDCVLDESLKDGVGVQVVGWGDTTVSGTGFNTRLNQGTTEVQTADCSKSTVNGIYTGCDPNARPAGEIGAGGRGVDACFGDSGGPLYLKTDRGTFLVGITSRAYMGVPQNAPCGYGGIYTRPDSVIPWIEKHIGEPISRPICTEPPVVTADEVRVSPGRSEPVTLHVHDPDGQSWTAVLKTAPQHGRVVITEDTITFEADKTYEGEDSFVLTVTDDGSAAYPLSAHASADVSVPVTAAKGASGCKGGCDSRGGPTDSLALLAASLLWMRRRSR